MKNQLLRRDTNFDGVGDGFLPSSAFTAINNLAILGTGINPLLEIILTSNDGNVEFGYDNVTISGNFSAVPEQSSIAMLTLAGSIVVFRGRMSERTQIHNSP